MMCILEFDIINLSHHLVVIICMTSNDYCCNIKKDVIYKYANDVIAYSCL